MLRHLPYSRIVEINCIILLIHDENHCSLAETASILINLDHVVIIMSLGLSHSIWTHSISKTSWRTSYSSSVQERSLRIILLLWIDTSNTFCLLLQLLIWYHLQGSLLVSIFIHFLWRIQSIVWVAVEILWLDFKYWSSRIWRYFAFAWCHSVAPFRSIRVEITSRWQWIRLYLLSKIAWMNEITSNVL